MSDNQTIKVPVPAGFDPNRHTDQFLRKVSEKLGVDGPMRLEHIDEKGYAIISRSRSYNKVVASSKTERRIELVAGVKPNDVKKYNENYSNTDQHPGFYLTEFNPYASQPYLVLTKMAEDEVLCRREVAKALGCPEWEVQVKKNQNSGGFTIKMPSSYVASKHDEKLAEAAEAVGEVGWYVKADPKTLVARMYESTPPTFDPLIPYPMQPASKISAYQRGGKGWEKLLVGMNLPDPGKKSGSPFYLDLGAAPHTQLSGTSGSGKSVTINAMIGAALSQKFLLAVVDLPHKAVDFTWCKPWVMPGGWGCESKVESLATMRLLYEEGERRARLLKEYDVQNWKDLPPSAEELSPIFIVVDELTGLFVTEEIPKGVSKDSPEYPELVLEPQQKNLVTSMLKKYIKQIAAEMRFVGLHLLISSQVSSTNTGVGTDLRMNLANKILLGPNPTKGNRNMSLTDTTRVPYVPANIQADADAARGVGVSELEGATPTVFKTAFATTSDYSKWLNKLGLPTTDNPRPSSEQIARLTPAPPEGVEGEVPASTTERRKKMESQTQEWETDSETGEKLTGFERANAARSALAAGK